MAKPVKIAIIANAAQAAKVFDSTANRAKSMGDRIRRTVKGIAKAGAAAGLAVIGTAFVKGFSRLNNIDVARTKMKALGYTARQSQSLMDSALKSVKGTSFGLDEAATAAASAAAAGVKQGKSMDAYLTTIANTASLTGRSMTDVGAIVNKVNTNSIASMAELNQINDAGIGITQGLAKHYGVTAGELRKMVSRGEVDAATFNKVLGSMTKDAAKTMGSTLPAIIANIGASLGRIGAAFLENAFPAIKSGAAGILDALGGFEDRAVDIAKKVNAALSGFVDWLKGVDFSPLVAALTSLKDSGMAALDGLREAAEPFAGFLSNMWTILGPILSTLGKFVLGTGFVVLKVALEGIGKAAAPVARALKNVTDWFVRNSGPIKTIAIIIGSLLTPVMVGLTLAALKQLAVVGIMNAAWLAYAVVSKGMAVAQGIATAATWLFNTALLANPITWVVVAIIALIAAIVLLIKNWDTVTAAIGKAWDWIRTKTAEGVNAIVAWVKGLPGKAKAALASLGSRLGSAVRAAWDAAKRAVIIKIAEVVSTIRGLPGKAKSALGNLSGLLRGAGRAIINGLINGIKSMFGGVKGALGDLTGKLTSWKGPPKRDKVLLKPAAALIMNGFIDQINDKRRELRRTLQNVTKDVAAMGGTTPELGGNFAVYGHGTHAGGVTNVTNVNVTLEAPVGASAVEIGRELSTYLKAYERAGGR